MFRDMQLGLTRIFLLVGILLAPLAAPVFAKDLYEDAVSGDIEQPSSVSKHQSIPLQIIALIDEYLQPADIDENQLYAGKPCPLGNTQLSADMLLARVTKHQGVAADFVPKNLVRIDSFMDTKNDRAICLEQTTAKHLQAMTQDARLLGLRFLATSGYRSAADQEYLYDLYAPQYNNGVLDRVAKAHHSEHRLGTTIDLGGLSAGYMTGHSFGSSPEYAWMRQFAHEYGFVQSYKPGQEYLTGYMNEPWHWRFVGVEAATLLRYLDHSLAIDPQLVVNRLAFAG